MLVRGDGDVIILVDDAGEVGVALHQRPSEQDRDDHRAGIEREDVLEPVEGELRNREHLVDRVGGAVGAGAPGCLAHRSPRGRWRAGYAGQGARVDKGPGSMSARWHL